MKSLPTYATVRVPATTSNLGPGFDTLGIALNLHNIVRVERIKGDTIRVRNTQVTEHAGDEARMPSEAVTAFQDATGVRVTGVEIQVSADVPIARGLGSSVTVRLGIVMGLNALYGNRLDTDEVLGLVASLEGHPDNVTPALFGGFAVVSVVDDDIRFVRVRVPPQLKFCIVVPDFEVRTDHARKVLPPAVPFADAAYNIARTSLITAAFVEGKYELLSGLFKDKLHQPYREQLIPQLNDVIQAGVEAGAYGGWLSGSGSSIVCLTKRHPSAVATAMKRAFARKRVECKTLILEADNSGAKIRAY